MSEADSARPLPAHDRKALPPHDSTYQPDEGRLYCRDLPSTPNPSIGTVLVTGGTGYIGGRLIPELLARGYKVRVMVRGRSPEHAERWPNAEVVVADASDITSLSAALNGVHTAYYLIHSLLLGPGEFEATDLANASHFRRAATQNGLSRIIYLGGLGDVRTYLSPHLRSRARVAEELASGAVPTTVLRAAVIIGSGSASYEIIQHLVRRLPVLLIPRWGHTKCQPISIRDVVKYLVGVLEKPETSGVSFDIGGRDVLTYEMMLQILADILGKKRLFITLPVSGLRFFAYLAGVFTPVPAPITRSLMEGLRNDVVCHDDRITSILPFEMLSYRDAIVRALSREDQDAVYTRWSDAYPPAHQLAMQLHELSTAPRFMAKSSLLTTKQDEALFRSVCRIGGKEGWFHGNWMWRLRGMLDRLLMGVGTARGRRSSSRLRVNDVIDFWRVEDLAPKRRLLLRAEMKLPGRAWLEFRIDPEGGKNRLSVKAHYDTRTLVGKIYWYVFLPFHWYIFARLLRQIEKRS